MITETKYKQFYYLTSLFSNLIFLRHFSNYLSLFSIYNLSIITNKQSKLEMISLKPYPYRSYQLTKLVKQLQNQAQNTLKAKKSEIENERKMHSSCNEIKKSYRYRKTKPFNNKTKEGEFFEKNPPQVPYLFIPKYKNETFIMPDRIFEKGEAGKRFHIKMKDTSIYSFKDPEGNKILKHLHRQEKDRTISGRKMEELNRILNENDGREKAKRANQNLKTRRIFNPTRVTSDAFSITSPMMEPREDETFQTKKVSLNKTFGPNLWRPVSRGERLHQTSNSFGGNFTQSLHRAASHRG